MVQHRTIAAVLALGLAVHGFGLPQFVHAVTEHIAPHGAEGAASISGCHVHVHAAASHPHQCRHHAPDDSTDATGHDSTGHEDCPICHLLASAAATSLLPLLTAAIVAAPTGWTVPLEPDRLAPTSVAPARTLRGPPALI